MCALNAAQYQRIGAENSLRTHMPDFESLPYEERDRLVQIYLVEKAHRDHLRLQRKLNRARDTVILPTRGPITPEELQGRFWC